MNKEEIQEALKIIREPIIVNCIEYKYFDQENYDKLVRTYENCRWFIDNWEQFEQNVEYQKKEIDRLNKVLKYLEKYFQEKEEYENAELVRQLKEANIEWLENALGDEE